MSKDCAVLIFSCDRYRDLWPAATTLFSRHWPDCPWDKVLASDSLPPTFPGFRSISCGGGNLEWSVRLQRTLEQLDAEYVLMFLDDFFLTGRADTPEVLRLFAEMQRIGAPCLRLVPHPQLQAAFHGTTLVEEHVRGLPYRTSTQASFWQRRRLLEMLLPTENIWDFEAAGSARSERWPEPFLAAKKSPVPYIDVLSRGKWMPRGLELCRREGIAVDLANRPAFSAREHLSWTLRAAMWKVLGWVPSWLRLYIRRWRPRLK